MAAARGESPNSSDLLRAPSLAGQPHSPASGKRSSISLLNNVLYCSRAWSRNCRAVASRNVSTLAPGGASSPDFA